MDNGNEVTVKKVSKARRIVRYSVAVAASLLLIFVCIEGYNFYSLSAEKLFAEKYSGYHWTTAAGTTESEIEKAYKEEKYTEVISLNRNSVVSIKDVFLTGMSYLETDDLSKTISSYQVVIADMKGNKNLMLKDAAEYYLALAYLKNNDYDQAIELMNTIHDNSSHLYTKKFSRKYIKTVKRLKWR